MLIGVPKEIKNNEFRVAITPAGVLNLCLSGHEVIIETEAGIGSSFTDEDYIKVGATVVATAQEVWNVEMVMKVKEPEPVEYGYFREGLILFTYLHLASQLELTKELLNKKVIGIAYETVQLPNNTLPLLAPMSEVAGRMATQIGAQYLQQTNSGKGILLGGVTGVSRGNVTIIGGGQAGTNAARIAVGMGARVTVLDLSVDRLRQLEEIFGNDIQTLVSNPLNIALSVTNADLVIGAVLIPGTRAPKLVSEEVVKSMKAGSVIVDIAIDQGGIFATSGRATSHKDPIYIKHGVIHYAVANMPGAVPQTSTIALTNVTIPYALQIANKGVRRACLDDLSLQKGINTIEGHVTYKAVADAVGADYYVSAEELLSNFVEI